MRLQISSYNKFLTRPSEFDVVATMNLNGDFISDAFAAQVGGIGIAPGATLTMKQDMLFLKPLMVPLRNMLD